jgi:uncharacterized protein
MKLDLSEIAKTPGSRASYSFEERLPDEEDTHFIGPARGELTATNTGRMLLLTGHVRAETEVACSRCLKPMRMTVEKKLEEEFATRPAGPQGQVMAIEDDEPLARVIDEDSFDLDLTELLRQNVLVAMPLQPICGEQCRGLCPRCGHDLNDGDCGCHEQEPESPFSVLRELLNRRDQP